MYDLVYLISNPQPCNMACEGKHCTIHDKSEPFYPPLCSEPGWITTAGPAGVLAQDAHQPHGRGGERGQPW